MIDPGALHLEHPFAGSRMLRDLLRAGGVVIGRLAVATLMRRMSIEALYRRPNTSKPVPGHKIYPYLLRQGCSTLCFIVGESWAQQVLAARDMMADVTWRDIGSLITVASIIGGLVIAWVRWRLSADFASRADIGAIQTRIDEIDTRVRSLPSRAKILADGFQ